MPKLTERRLTDATEILEKYRRHLHESGRMDCSGFEMALRECWGTGYQTIKSLVIDLSKIDRYKFLAAYYMQHQNATGPVVEFQPQLAKLYCVSYYHSDETEAKRKEFWGRLTAGAEEHDEVRLSEREAE